MFKEFAVDPSLMTEWESFKDLRDKFGVFEGRFISDFPHKDWKKAVARMLEHRSHDSHPVRNSATILAWLQSRDGRRDLRFARKPRAYDAAKAWVDNAEAQAHTFDGLLTAEETKAPNGIRWDETLCLSKHPRFEVNTQPRVSRESKELLRVIQPLLRISTKVVWVDRYLYADNGKLETVVDCLTWLREVAAITSFEMHLGLDQREELNVNVQRDNFRRKLGGSIPDHLQVSLYWWSQSQDENIHPRFVLTDVGGLQFDHGTDPGLGTTIVHLLNRIRWEDEVRRYHEDTSDLSFRGTITL